MAEQELDIASLGVRVEHLEEEGNLRKKNISWLKRYLDDLSQEFNNRPELGQLESLQSAIAQLTEQVAALQQRVLPLDETKTAETPGTGETAADESVNAEIDETDQDEEIPPVAQQPSLRAFSDEEFKAERIILLLDRIYTLEEERQNQAISAEEFWRRYNAGERDFTGINLAGVNLSGQFLQNLNLSEANLTKANFSRIRQRNLNLSEANLRGASLKEIVTDTYYNEYQSAILIGANLENADLYQIKLQNAKICETNLRKANLFAANLQGADLSQANLSEANLTEVDLSNEANLSHANLSAANLSNANLRTAKLMGAKLKNANLSNANLFEANLQEANLHGANLQQVIYNPATIFPTGFDPTEMGAYLIAPGTLLQKANLSRADLQSVDLSVATLNEVDMRGANLQSAKLCGANLNSADLRTADLSNADLSGADLTSAKLGGANLYGTKLTGAIMPDGTTHE